MRTTLGGTPSFDLCQRRARDLSGRGRQRIGRTALAKCDSSTSPHSAYVHGILLVRITSVFEQKSTALISEPKKQL